MKRFIMNREGIYEKSALVLWYQYGENFGDVLLYQTTRNFLQSLGFSVDSYEVGEPCEQIMRKANNYDFLLFAGGGIIERYVPNVIRYFKEDYYLLQKPYGIIGLGVANYNYELYKEKIKFWIENAQFFYVRDQMTKSFLDELTKTSIAVCSADCVFSNLKVQKMKSDDNINRNGRIGLNIRKLPYEDLTGPLNMSVLSTICKEVRFDILIQDCENDGLIEYIDRYINVYDSNRNNKVCEENVDQILKQINSCEFVVAMRFHVILCAAVMGVIPIPIIYSPKVKALAEQLGIINLAVSIDELDLIPKKLNYARENKDLIMERIRQNCMIMSKRSDMMYNEIKNIIMR